MALTAVIGRNQFSFTIRFQTQYPVQFTKKEKRADFFWAERLSEKKIEARIFRFAFAKGGVEVPPLHSIFSMAQFLILICARCGGNSVFLLFRFGYLFFYTR